MHKFVLSTDTSCDVFRNELDLHSIAWVPLTYSISGKVYADNFCTDDEYKDFYSKLREGIMPSTSQINIFAHEEFFESLIQKGASDIVHLSLSSGLSNTYNSACLAAENVMERHSGVRIYIVQTLAATQGHRYLLDEARILRDSGADAKTTAKTVEDMANRLHHWIIVDDLFHLKRGGRVSGASAYIGSMLKIKPILIINDEGKLALVKKVKGTLKAFASVVEMVQQYCENTIDPKLYIASADAPDKASEFEQMLLSSFPKAQISTGWIGPIIGSHTGADTIGLVFLGKNRLDNK